MEETGELPVPSEGRIESPESLVRFLQAVQVFRLRDFQAVRAVAVPEDRWAAPA